MQLTIYKSSAGSGKTFTLVKEYLELVIADPFKYKKILAVTFTKKATAEMKSRIVADLESLSLGENPMLENLLRASLGEEINIRDRAKTVLQNILHNYSFFSVSTIDSFFNKVVRSFGRELGLPWNYTIEMDTNPLLEEIIDRIFLDIKDDPYLARWLKEFAFSKIEEDKGWNIDYELKNLGQEIFKDSFQNTDTREEFRAKIDLFKKQLYVQKKEIQEVIKGRVDDIKSVIKRHGVQANEFRDKSRGVVQLIVSKSPLTLQDSLSKKEGTVREANDLLKKTASREYWDCCNDGLTEMISGLIDYCVSVNPLIKSIDLSKKYIYAFGILKDMKEKLAGLRREKEILLVNDITNLINKVVQESDAPFIFEKSGSFFDNFLLDEFQDTSTIQWENLRPLIENSLSLGNNNLIVGDIKQAIYRWRGGNMELMAGRIYEDLNLFREIIKDEFLDTNFRSKLNIVEFNNNFFEAASALIPVENIRNESHLLKAAYGNSVQKITEKNNSGGYVSIEIIAKGDEDWLDVIGPGLLLEIDSWLQKGYSQRDIAILVRANGDANLISEYLSKNKPELKVISAQSLFVGKSHKVKLLIDAAKYLFDPDDAILHSRILHNHNEILFSEMETPLSGLCSDHPPALPSDFVENKERLRSLRAYDLFEELITVFKLNVRPDAYLVRFLDLVLEYQQTPGKNLFDFLKYWEEKGQIQTIQVSEEEDAIRIETIHKSKGLQYPIVLIPRADWSILPDSRVKNFMWARTDRPPFKEMGNFPVSFNKELEFSYFSDDYFRDYLLTCIDNLNILYVALTRAVIGMKVWNPVKDTDKFTGGASFSVPKLMGLVLEQLEETLAGSSLEKSNEKWLFTHGEKTFFPGKIKDLPVPVHIPEFNLSPLRKGLRVRTRSYNGFKEGVREKIDEGILFHAILEKLSSPRDVDKILNDFFYRGTINEKEKLSLREKLSLFLENEEVKNWFSDDWKVMAEKDIVTPEGKIIRPDRVMIKESQALVVDYKTGRPEKKHEAQIKEYGAVLTQMGYIPELKLFYLEDEKIVTVSPE